MSIGRLSSCQGAGAGCAQDRISEKNEWNGMIWYVRAALRLVTRWIDSMNGLQLKTYPAAVHLFAFPSTVQTRITAPMDRERQAAIPAFFGGPMPDARGWYLLTVSRILVLLARFGTKTKTKTNTKTALDNEKSRMIYWRDGRGVRTGRADSQLSAIIA
ncbi:hypothetical protein C8Q74DRAFT_1219553 [Fomes fomentarius]|nr:hypothetical protein C8Q74DRAFT_1219553 [Fomes fomentarius]